jgi:hypothetical protein
MLSAVSTGTLITPFFQCQFASGNNSDDDEDNMLAPCAIQNGSCSSSALIAGERPSEASAFAQHIGAFRMWFHHHKAMMSSITSKWTGLFLTLCATAQRKRPDWR